MNKTELLKLIIAAVTAVVAKELLSFLIKRTRRVGHLFAWLKAHPRYIGLKIETTVLVFMFWILIFAGDDSKVATRRDVRFTALGMIVFFGQLEQFGRHIREVRDLYHQNKNGT